MSAEVQNVAASGRDGSRLIAIAAPEVVQPLADDGSYSLRAARAGLGLRRLLSSPIMIRADHG